MTFPRQRNHYNVKFLKGYGHSISVKNSKIILKDNHNPFSQPSTEEWFVKNMPYDRIILQGKGYVSTESLSILSENNKTVILLDTSGNSITTCHGIRDSYTATKYRIAQYDTFRDKSKTDYLTQQITKAKLESQIKFLKSTNHPEVQEGIIKLSRPGLSEAVSSRIYFNNYCRKFMGLFGKKLSKNKDGGFTLKIREGYLKDKTTQKCRISQNVMDFLNLDEGDFIEIQGSKKSVMRCAPLHNQEKDDKIIRINELNRNFMVIFVGEKVSIRKINTTVERIILNPTTNMQESISDPTEIAKIDKIESDRMAKIESDKIAKEKADRSQAIHDEEQRVIREKEKEKILSGEGDYHDYSSEKTAKICSAPNCNENNLHSFNSKNCKLCSKIVCDVHILPENHECVKHIYVKFLRKKWLRKYGLNVSTGKFQVICDKCGYNSEFLLIEDAGEKREFHIKNGCDENNVFLEGTE